MSTPVLSLRHLTKYFRSHWTFRALRAIEDISLDIHAGEIFGFLGHNGAGKTTTIKCIVGLSKISSGEILLQGEPLRSARQHRFLGYLPEQPYFYDHLTVAETLSLFAALHDLPASERKTRIDETMEEVGLSHRRNSPVRILSKGLQQRLGFAQAVLNKPKLLILDEPFSGLDPLGRKDIRQLILKYRQQGTTVFMSSHILADVEELCERVSILAHGSLKRILNISELHSLSTGEVEVHLESLPNVDLRALQATHNQVEAATIITFPSLHLAQQGIDRFRAAGANIIHVEQLHPSLEDIFVETTKNSERTNS